MRLKPVYATDPNLVDTPLTEVPNQWAPQQGIHLYHFPLSLDSQGSPGPRGARCSMAIAPYLAIRPPAVFTQLCAN